MIPDPTFTLNALAALAIASGLASNLTVIVVALKGRPTVRKDEFDEHRAHVSARFAGVNDKINNLNQAFDGDFSSIRDEIKGLTGSLSHINADLQRVVGRLEGQLTTDKNGRAK